MVVLYEDLQWIDPSSLELLSLVIERIARLPVLVLATARPEFRPPWAEEAHLTSLTLGRLDHSDARKLVTSVSAGRPLSRGVAEEILAHSEGVPLFVEELTKAVLEARPGSGSEAFRREAPQIIMVPASLQSWLVARTRPTRNGEGSCEDRSGNRPRIRIRPALRCGRATEGELASALERLCYLGLMFRRGNQLEATFPFKHALIQDAGVRLATAGRPARLAPQDGRSARGHFPETIETQPELLAYHFTEAGVAERAVGYWSKAGQQALRLSAMAEAAALLARG